MSEAISLWMFMGLSFMSAIAKTSLEISIA